MGQLLDRNYVESISSGNNQVTKISDISQLPPELALAILKNLNATDLCLAACV
ncbi:unnamed protein product, partial [Rotaria magnacalcarata]